MIHTFPFQVDVSPGSSGLQILFALRRGSITFVASHPPAEAHRFEGLRRLVLAWAEPLPAGTPVFVRIQAEGEVATVVGSQWTTLPGLIRALLGLPPLPPLKRLHELLSRFFTTAPTPAQDILLWRDTRATAPFLEDKVFFNKMERETWVDDPSVWTPIVGVSDTQRSSALGSTGALQLVANGLRARQSGSTATSPYDGGVSGKARDDLRVVSKLMEWCASAITGDKRLSFLRFATGHLALLQAADLPAPTAEILDWKGKAGQPDTGFHFYFAELADLCLQSGVDQPFWEPLYPALVHSLSRFWECYGPAGSKIVLGQEVYKPYPFTPAVNESDLAPGLNAFLAAVPTASLSPVHQNYVQQYLDSVP
jgi:hypothetical protein